MISLVDSINSHLVDVWLVFYDVPRDYRFWRWLKPGFNHVEVWRLDRGAWARVDTCLELLNAEVHLLPPWESGIFPETARFLHYVRLVSRGKVREPFMVGPITCVELVKAVLGIRAIFVRTPYALYKHLRKTKCSHSFWASLQALFSRWLFRLFSSSWLPSWLNSKRPAPACKEST